MSLSVSHSRVTFSEFCAYCAHLRTSTDDHLHCPHKSTHNKDIFSANDPHPLVINDDYYFGKFYFLIFAVQILCRVHFGVDVHCRDNELFPPLPPKITAFTTMSVTLRLSITNPTPWLAMGRRLSAPPPTILRPPPLPPAPHVKTRTCNWVAGDIYVAKSPPSPSPRVHVHLVYEGPDTLSLPFCSRATYHIMR